MIIKTFEDFINEKIENYKPLEGTCGIVIGKKDYEFNIGKLVDFAKNNYKSELVELDDIYNLSCFKDIDKYDKIDGVGTVNIDGVWKKMKELTKEERIKYRKEQEEIIWMSNLKFPIILIKNNKNKIIVILDGNHRVKKAKLLNKKFIRSYIIPENDIVNLTEKELKELKKNGNVRKNN